ncbi:hypothetical protein FACS1894180_2850 [Bacteroidia bacterium]|nr:hypothetical protein FACS1894180_2850 [Bacteroidia bacterium]
MKTNIFTKVILLFCILHFAFCISAKASSAIFPLESGTYPSNFTFSGIDTLYIRVGASQSSDVLTINGNITGTFKVVKIGLGKLILNGECNFNGMIIQAGCVEIPNPIVAQSIISAGAVTDPDIVVNSSAALRFGEGGYVNNDIAGAGNVIFYNSYAAGFNTVGIYANITITGVVTVSSGVRISIGHNNGGLTLRGNITGDIAIASDAEVKWNRMYVSTTYGGVMSGEGNVHFYTNQANGIAYTLSGVNTLTGAVTVEHADLVIASGGSLLNASRINLSTEAASIQFNNSTTRNYTMPINGPGKVYKANSGRTNLSQPTYTGATVVTGGILSVTTANFASPSINVSTAGNGLVFVTSGAVAHVYTGTITGNGNIGKEGTGKLIVNGTTTGFTGAVSVANTGGILQLHQNVFNNASQVNLATSSSVLRFEGDTYPFNPPIQGVGKVEIAATNLSLYGTNTYTGQTSVESGKRLNLYSSFGASNIYLVSSTSKVYFGYHPVSHKITYDAVLSGLGQFHINTSTDTLVLNGVNTLTGTTYINNGYLKIGYTGRLENSDIILNSDNSILDITSRPTPHTFNYNNVKIKSLSSSYTGSKVILMTDGFNNDLIIGENNTSQSTYTFAGKFETLGRIIKTRRFHNEIDRH